MPKTNPKWVSSELFLRNMPHGTVFVSQLLPPEAPPAASPHSDPLHQQHLDGDSGGIVSGGGSGGGGSSSSSSSSSSSGAGLGGGAAAAAAASSTAAARRARAKGARQPHDSEPLAAAEAAGAHYGGYRHLLNPETGPFATLRRGGVARQRRSAAAASSSSLRSGGAAGALGGAPLLHGALEYSPDYLDERRLPFFVGRAPPLPGQLFQALATEGERRLANEAFAPRLPHRGADGEPTLLTFTKLCALKTAALELWVARGWELSTVALGLAAFERSVLAGRVGKANRRLYMAVCMLLAWKMNESRENDKGREALVQSAREGEGGKEAASQAAAGASPVTSALAAAFRQPRAAILAAEFDVFVHLGFSLTFRTRQLKPILERLEAAVGRQQ